MDFQIYMNVQVDVAGGGTVTYVDDTLFPIAKARALQRLCCANCAGRLKLETKFMPEQ